MLGAGLVDGSLSVGPCLICSSLGSEVSTHSAAGSLLVRSGFPAGLSLSYAWISVDSRMVLGCFPAVRGKFPRGLLLALLFDAAFRTAAGFVLGSNRSAADLELVRYGSRLTVPDRWLTGSVRGWFTVGKGLVRCWFG